VQFFGVGPVDTQIVALAPGQTRDVEVGIPEGCYPPTYHGSCDYSIVADANSVVEEGSESNNVVLSLCLLPGG
jgi:subtilase family serine protease